MKTPQLPYADRRQAGRLLADHLEHLRDATGLVVLALPRGGVAVGFEVALALQAPLDVFVVRKIGMPGQPEYAIGAIATGGTRVMRPLPGLAERAEEVLAVLAREAHELARREQAYRGTRPALELRGRTVVVVDDGVATGATLEAALTALRQQRPLRLVAAVPVGAPDATERLASDADEVVSPATPEDFGGVGRWYRRFEPSSDDEVTTLLGEARRQHAARTRGMARSP